MSSSPFLHVASRVWAALVVAVLVLRVTLVHPPLSVAEVATWLVLAGMPSAIVLIAFREASPTIAEVLYDAEQGKDASGIRSRRDVRR